MEHAALAAIDRLMARLKAGDGVDYAKTLMHRLVDDSTAAQLWCLFVPVQQLAERQTDVGTEDEGGLLVCRRSELLKAKAAAARGDVDDCIWILRNEMETTLLSQARHPMIRAGLGLSNSRPSDKGLEEWYEFGQLIRDQLEGLGGES